MVEKRIRITARDISAEALLNESVTASKIWDSLPITAAANTWGDEIYFSISVNDKPSADAKEVVEIGELAYWPPGKAFCIFFGMTPASSNGQIRPASAVNPIGKIVGDSTVFKAADDGDTVKIERI